MSDTPDSGAAAPAESSPESAAEAVINSIDAGASEASGNIDVGSEEVVDAADASDTELEEILEDGEASEEEVKEAAVELKRRLMVKINGEEVEREIDLNNEDALREMIQKGESADQKFQESAGIRKQMEQFVQLMQSDPIRALQELGHDPDTIAEQHMQKRLEQMQKSPEQIELEELKAKVEKAEAEKKAIEDERFAEKQEVAQREYERQLDQEITTSLEASDLPKSPYVVKRLAEVMMVALDHAEDGQEVSVSDVLPIVEKQIKSEIQQMFGAMPADVVESLLGAEVTGKMRKNRRAKAKGAAATETASSVKATGKSELNKAKASEEPKDPDSASDFFKTIGSY